MKIITHNGTFHPDDVFSVAVLFIRFGDMEVLRTRDEKFFTDADFLVDVGGIYDKESNRFDHHQKGGAGKRDGGSPYASFGLVWKEFGKDLCRGNEALSSAIDGKLVAYVDAMDNGAGALQKIAGDVFPYTIGHAIMAFNPTWKHQTTEEQDARFIEAVSFAKGVLQREIADGEDELAGMKLAEEVYLRSSDKAIAVFDEDYPWEFVLSKYKDAIFAITPNPVNGTWEVSAVRDDPYSFKNRKDFPAHWGGKRDGELTEATGIGDAIFCHNALFFAVAKSKAGAMLLAQKALDFNPSS